MYGLRKSRKYNMNGFFDYLQRQKLYSSEAPVFSSVGMIVVIPCFDEPDMLSTLQSLCSCALPDCNVEIIVVINAPEYATAAQLRENEHTRESIRGFMPGLPSTIHISVISVSGIRKKDAGAGFARKIGMDEAVRQFMLTSNKKGVIVSLDADCLVAPDYLREIRQSFESDSRLNTAIIPFEHILPDKKTNPRIYRAGVLYELYLRYYSEALRYIGFPYPYHTIGSCFAVRADAYVKVGGMNKKQAGEDFYFLHKLFLSEHIKELKNTAVYPSSRISNRVVFGTGPAIRKMTESEEVVWETYSFDAFCALKELFDGISEVFKSKSETIRSWMVKIPESVKDFLQSENYLPALDEINANCASLPTFKKRFFTWFNAFMILKFMHYVHPKYYHLTPVEVSSACLLTRLSIKLNDPVSPEKLLDAFKKL